MPIPVRCMMPSAHPGAVQRCRWSGASALATALSGVLALTACGGGGSSPAPTTMKPAGTPPLPPDPAPPANPVAAAVPLVSQQHFRYTLTDGQESISDTGWQPLECPSAGCAVPDLSLLEHTGTRQGFQTVAGPSHHLSYRHYGLWGQYGQGAVTLGSGTLALQQDGHTWRGPFQTVHAWSAGQATGTNPTGTGSATWRGSAEAVSTADLLHLRGTVRLHIPELGQPLLDAHINLEGHTVPLQWRQVPIANGSFQQGVAAEHLLHGRFHGPGHAEAWGLFHTDAFLGAFGAKRHRQAPAAQ